MIGYLIVDGVINLSIDGKMSQVHPTAANYEVVKDALINKASEEEISSLLKVDEAVSQYTNHIVEIKSDGVYYEGIKVNLLVAQRIMDFFKKGLPFEPLVNFLVKLKNNTSFHSQQETYSFLEKCGLHITEDGDFLGYKAVRNDWMDIYSGTILYGIGAIVQMDRSEVDDDFRKDCSYGFHVGTLNYAQGYGGTDSRILLVKVSPEDVVSVAGDGHADKLRACRVEVIKEIDRNTQLNQPLYTSSAEPYDDEDEDEDDSWVDDLDDDYDSYDEYDHHY
jgi:hypothetical protein